MNNLIITKETFTNGYIPIILTIMSIAAILLGILVITSKNPIISILFLIGLFASISLYLIFLGMNFIGLSYLIVYIGAVSILFLFILMLINIRVSELQSNTSNSLPLSIIIIIWFNYFSFELLPYDIAILGGSSNLGGASSGATSSYSYSYSYSSYIKEIKKGILGDISYYIKKYTTETDTNSFFNSSSLRATSSNNDVLFVTSQIWDGNLAETGHITSIGNIMYTNYNIWLIIASFILLLSMVGSIVITIRQKDTDTIVLFKISQY